MKTNEEIRLAALHSLKLLDTPASESFDRITRMASQIFDLPIAAISLTDSDRQWFKARVGVEHQSIPRDKAPCAAVAESTELLVVPDLSKDAHYHDSVLAKTGVRFYAGAPLTTREGHCLGALCVLGAEPRETTENEIASLQDLAAMVMAQIELQHAYGRIEPVSGLPNRTQFSEDVSDLLRGPAWRTAYTGVLIDLAETRQLDDLSRVMGTAEIDAKVRDAAQRLRAIVGGKTTLYHVSTTQFAFIRDRNIAGLDCMVYLRQLLGDLDDESDLRFLMTPAIGVAPLKPDTTPSDFLRAMSSAAQDARLTATHVAVFSQASDDRYQRSFRLLQDFDNALQGSDQLSIVFQPRVSLPDGHCVGAEVLLRWLHPELGAISPGEFAPIIEQSPHIGKMTAWVLDAALREAGNLKSRGVIVPVSVNISAANLDEPDFVQRVQLSLLRHGIRPAMLELEVTESAIMKDAANALAKLQALSDGGVRLSIDDFGTGYSSLSYLQTLPTTVVKIDQSFIRSMDDGFRETNLVRSMIQLSHDLGYQVVAEGVETTEAAEALSKMGCDEAQGYLFAKPLSPAAFEEWFFGRKIEHQIAC